MAWRAVTDKQWGLIKEQLPRPKRRKKGGRPPADAAGALGLIAKPFTVEAFLDVISPVVTA